MPWKNGNGQTTEIAIHPVDADLSNFGWRISVATISRDGPFSTFPGIDRSLAILSGQGLVLDIKGTGKLLLTSSSPVITFPADGETSATLMGAAVTDLNLMVRRTEYQGDLRVEEVCKSKDFDLPGDWNALIAVDPIAVQSRTASTKAEPLDAILVTDKARVKISGNGRPAKFLLATIHAKAWDQEMP